MRKSQLSKKQKTAVIGTTVAALMAGGVAYAYWTSNGSGTGSAATSAGASDLLVSQTSTITNMYPGDSAQAITGTVKNQASNSAYVTQVVASIASVTQAANPPAGTCDSSDYTLANATMAVGQDVASSATVPFSGASIKFNNKGTNQDACKGATVNLLYTVS